MYLDNNIDDIIYFDIEANGLTPDRIWCAVFKYLGNLYTFTDYDTIKGFIDEHVQAGHIFVGHNSISFDNYWLANLIGACIPLSQTLDTLVLSYLYSPNLEGGHSLEAYGDRLKFPKIAHTDWTQFSPEMLARCTQDVLLTEKVYLALRGRMVKIGFSELSCEIEHKTRELVDHQQRRGFYFKKGAAQALGSSLRAKQQSLEEEVHKLFPPVLGAVVSYTRRFLKDGSDTQSFLRHKEKYPKITEDRRDGETIYTCWDWKVFNIGSPKQRIERLTALGYDPVERTPTGQPKVDEESLLKFAASSGRKEVGAIAEWLVVNGRANMIETWLNNLGSDSRMHGKVFTCGASTRRMTHSSPNTANIPSGAKAAYGHECRALWSVEPDSGLCLVGVDAGGLETVGLLHYLGNKEAEEILTKPKPDDVHTMNARLLTESLKRPIDREWGAKTCVPLDTKILTKRGWKFWNELMLGEQVLGYNSQTKLKEWTVLRAINRTREEVFDINDSFRSFKATANHRWFVRQRRMGSKSWARINGRYMEDQVRTTAELNTESNIIMNAPFNEEQDTVSYIKGIDGKYDVNWEQRVLQMSHAERVQFVQGFMLADGYIPTKPPHTWRWSQNIGNIADGLLLASYLIHNGQLYVSEKASYNTRMWNVVLSEKSHVTGARRKITSLGEQDVWCPTTDLGSWVMRQGNIITITGNCWYAWLYGAYPPKLGSIVKGPPSDGDIVVETFFRNVPGLKGLIEEVQKEWKRNGGLLKTIDGGYVRCPSVNAALNYRIQSLGAIVMKLAAIILFDTASQQRLPYSTVGTIHDEWQMEVQKDRAEELGKLAVESISEAARRLKFNLPLGGAFVLGEDWSMTH